MAARKTERLMNLIFLLLATRQYLTKAQIRESIEAYRDATSVQAFDRMFERDKEELRELGIEVELGSHDPLFSDDQGYRIQRSAAELGDIELTREEAAVVGLATQVWQHAGLAAESTTALVKLKSLGIEVDTDALRMAEPRLSTAEPAFDAIWDAATRRVPVSFTYARPGGEASVRRLQPWGILSWRDRWYVGGFDLDRDAPRLFRVSRVLGDVEPIGAPGSYVVPPGTDMRKVARTLFPKPREEPAELLVADGRAQSLRRRGQVELRDDGRDLVTVTIDSLGELASEVVSYGPDVVVIGPDDLRERVVSLLTLAADQELRHGQS